MSIYAVIKTDKEGFWLSDPKYFDTRQEAESYHAERVRRDGLERWMLASLREECNTQLR
jgi:hypothetical protein